MLSKPLELFALNGVLGAGYLSSAPRISTVQLYCSESTPVTTYTVVPTTLWTHVEPSIGLICSCQPVNGDFFQNFCFLAAGRERSTDIGATRYYPSAYVSHFAISTGSSLPSIDYHHLNMKAAVQE